MSESERCERKDHPYGIDSEEFMMITPASKYCIAFSMLGTWFMKIEETESGPKFYFNREEFPDFTPDDFAKAFLEKLEDRGYLEKFFKRENQ